MPVRDRARRVAVALVLLPGLVACDSDGTDPDENALEFFIGTYALSPAPTMTCDLGGLGSATITIDTVEVADVTASQLELRVPVRASGDAFPTQRFNTEFAIDADADGSFGGLEPIDLEFDAGVVTVHGDGDLGFDGTYSQENDQFIALVESSFAVALGSAPPADCTDVALTVTGTRI